MAIAILAECGTLKAVMEKPVNELGEIKVGARKVGPVVSKRLHEILTHTEAASE